MVFSSFEFLFLFLPIALFFIYIAPSLFRNAVIFAVSLIFYAWGGIEYLPLILTVIASDYLFGIFIGRAASIGAKKAWLTLAVVLNLLILGFFKYADFLVESLSAIPALRWLDPPGLTLPIGISFYIFQALSYVIDVYKNEVAAQKDPLTFGAYVTLFPQLIAGPIVKYREIDEQLKARRRPSLFVAASGARTFVCGLAKKVLIANAAGELWQTIAALAPEDRTVLLSWLGILFYTLHIYFDFSGYSDMAIGLGKLLGFKFPENFNYPYVAKSIGDFWRRWHISLSSWFREYVYIPLGGNRRGRSRTYLNLLCVWFLTGLWHGASWNFVIWGLYYFILLSAEKAFFGRYLQRLPSAVCRFYSLFFVSVGWLIFAFDDAYSGLEYLRNMLGIGGAGIASFADLYEMVRNALFLAAAAFACTPLPKKLFYKFYEKSRAADVFSLALCLCGFLVCVIYLVDSSYNPFLYFRF